MANHFNVLDYNAPAAADLLAAGEESVHRLWGNLNSAVTLSNQSLRLCYFTARKSESVTQIRVESGTAAGATPTVIRFGLYLIAADGGATLVAATANDTTLLVGANTVYTKAFAAPYAKIAGRRYAVGLLVVTGATAPTVRGVNFSTGAELAIAARLTGALASQTDLPASFADASLGVAAGAPYAALLP